MKKIFIGGKRGGDFALVDDEDFELCSSKSWHMSMKMRPKASYKIGDRWKNVSMHRLILNFPEGKQIDHKDGNPLNNQKSNLRTCSNTQNQYHRKPKKGCKYKGIYQVKGKGKWLSHIMFNNKMKHLGTFESDKDAARAYNKAAKKYFGEFAWLNPV